MIVVVIYIACFSRLGALGLTGNDEPRYASIAREMSESGDWVTPRLNGSPWFEKPILYYWTAGVAFRVIGESDYAARLPSGIAALAAILAIAWAAKRFYTVATAVILLLVLPATIAIVGFARGAGPDMLFASALTVAMVLSAEVVSAVKISLKHCAAFGAALGIAALAKGPAAVVLAGGGIAIWAILAREWKRAMRTIHPAALTAFAIVAVPWYTLCAARNPDFLRTFFLLHNVERFATPVFHHVRPVWYFVPVIFLGLLPWVALIPGSAREVRASITDRTWASRPGLYFASWASFTFLFFSVSRSKLPGYVLPAIPALALLLSNAAVGVIQRRFTEGSRWTCLSLGFTWLLIAIGLGAWHARLRPDSPFADFPVRGWLVVLAAGGLLIVALGAARQITGAIVSNAIFFVLIFEAGNLAIVPRLDPLISSRQTARQAIDEGYSAKVWNSYQLREPWKFGIEYYLHHSLSEFNPANRARSDDISPTLLFTSRAGCAKIAALGLQCNSIQQVSPEAWLVSVR